MIDADLAAHALRKYPPHASLPLAENIAIPHRELEATRQDQIDEERQGIVPGKAVPGLPAVRVRMLELEVEKLQGARQAAPPGHPT